MDTRHQLTRPRLDGHAAILRAVPDRGQKHRRNVTYVNSNTHINFTESERLPAPPSWVFHSHYTTDDEQEVTEVSCRDDRFWPGQHR